MKTPAEYSHKRYYIYRVKNPGPESTVDYRVSTGSWSALFNDAMLWSCKRFVMDKALKLAKDARKWQSNDIIVVGTVDVSIRPGIFELMPIILEDNNVPNS